MLHTGINNDICQIPGGDISQNGVDYVKNIFSDENTGFLAQFFNYFCVALLTTIQLLSKPTTILGHGVDSICNFPTQAANIETLNSLCIQCVQNCLGDVAFN